MQEGGYDDWAERLRDPVIRARVAQEMVEPTNEWENLMLGASPEGTLLVGFVNEDLRGYIGRTLAEVAAERGTSPQETAMDLVIEDGSRVQVVYFLMSEDNVKRQIAIPWVAFDSDAGSMTTEPPFTNTSTHPRAYGNFARLLGKYVREERRDSPRRGRPKAHVIPGGEPGDHRPGHVGGGQLRRRGRV